MLTNLDDCGLLYTVGATFKTKAAHDRRVF